jgi:hypothetical protein
MELSPSTFALATEAHDWRVQLNAGVIQNLGRQQEMSLCTCWEEKVMVTVYVKHG